MSSITKDKNNRYHIRFYHAGKQIHITRDTKREVEAAKLNYKFEHADEKIIKPTSKFPTFEELFKEFIAYKLRNNKESTVAAYQYVYTAHLKYFDKKPIDKITARNIDEFHAELDTKNLSHKMKVKIHTYLQTALNFAKSRYRLPLNPAQEVGNFKNKEIKQEMQFWTENEFSKFIATFDNILHKSFFATLYLTGCRKGEAYALTWADFNPTDSTLIINKTYSRHTITHDRTFRITTPKSKSRTIAIPDNLIGLLNQLKNYFANTREIKINPTDFIFGITKPISDSDVLRIKNKHCEIAGVKQIRIHDFRHSLVSLLINRATADTIKNPLQLAYIIADRIGDNIDQVFKTYGHLFKTDEKAVINCLNIPL